MHLFHSFLTAFSTYSRIPVPRVEWTPENRRYSMCFFPLIGLAIGLMQGLWLLICSRLSIGPVLQGAVFTALPIAATGGIHMDGLMDTADALSSWQTPERRLEILKDSHVGAFAVMTCALYLLVMAGIGSELSANQFPMITACYLSSRAMSALTLSILPSARPGGMLDNFSSSADRMALHGSCAAYLLAATILWTAGGVPTLIFSLACLGLCTWHYRSMSARCFGGITGDLAGYYLQILELCTLASVMIGGKIL